MKEFVLYFVNFLTIAGLWEELVFRGLLFASLEERFGVVLPSWETRQSIGFSTSRSVLMSPSSSQR
ncbi:MAG: CPBP family intramembrane metalloprotease [Palaeococcus sp.]|nr:CPBP family intramembrane metalloprotease [Palaeococcus sp. (in: euryarchaeotes)]